MVLHLFATEEAECELDVVTRLTNGLQRFFVVQSHANRVRVPADLVRAVPINSTLLLEHVARRHLASVHLPGDKAVVVTSSFVDLPRDEPTSQLDSDVVLVSNHWWPWEGAWVQLSFAANLMHVGMRAVTSGRCDRPECICGPSDKFCCLCDACETHLRRLGYRDAIRHLKESFNWYNQRSSSQHSSLELPGDGLADACLPLTEHHAKCVAEQSGRVLEDKVVLLVLHFLSDLIPFVNALGTLGASPNDIVLIAKPYPYPNRDMISHTLATRGVTVYRDSDKTVESLAAEALRMIQSARRFSGRRLVVIEDGGYVAPLLHGPEFGSLCRRCAGVVEQTTKGMRNDEEIARPRFPILSVAKSAFKDQYESPEIGRVTVQNISRFVPNVKLSGEHAIVFGFGSVGEHVVTHLNRFLNMSVSVVDTDSFKVLKAQHRRDIVAEAATSLSGLRLGDMACLMVGTTGRRSITRSVLRSLERDCILVSTSSDQVEIDICALRKFSHDRNCREEGSEVFLYRRSPGKELTAITLLAEGYPINFYGSESLPNDTIDPVMTLLLLAAVGICERRDLAAGVQTKAVDEIVDESELVSSFLRLRHRSRRAKP